MPFPTVCIRMRSLLGVVALALLLGVGVAPSAASAQQQVQEDELSKFQLAQSYLKAGRYERAISLLEDLHAEQPETHAFYQKLKEAYENVKRYDDALSLVEKKLSDQRTPTLMAEKARLLYLRGDEQKAFDTWSTAVELAPEQRSTYRVVFYSLYKNRLFERAAQVLERGRETLGNDTAFQQNLARIYSLTADYDKAINEYLQLLQDDERKLSFVRNRLSRFTDKEEALKQYIAGAKQAVRDEPLYRPYRELLSWLHMEAEQYSEALDVVRAIDRLEEEQGRPLHRFGQQAARAGAYDVALKAYQEILDRHPEAPTAPQAWFGLGRMHEKWAEKQGERAHDADSQQTAPHYEKALDAYRTFLQKYPNHSRYADALRRLGRLQQDVFRNFTAADTTLRKVVQRFPDSDAARQAQYDLGRLDIQRDDLQEARLTFSRLKDDLHSGELADKARHQLALLHFYQGEFEAAQTLAQALNQNTSKDVANDAITLKVLLLENKGPDSTHAPLRTYAQARLAKRQHRADDALQTLDTLLDEHGRHPLADDARFLRAAVLQEQGRSQEALAAYQEFPLLHPRSPLADRSLFRAAQIQEQELEDPGAALKTYTKLLTDYPGSLLIPEARERIRNLRQEQGA